MTNKEEIQKTLLDCTYGSLGGNMAETDYIADQMGMNGFEKAHTWKSKIGNK